MIRSFSCKETKKIFERDGSRQFSTSVQKQAFKKLLMLHAVTRIDDLRVPPGNRLEKLSGDLKNRYSIRVNDQWRVVFSWMGSDAENVALVDYH